MPLICLRVNYQMVCLVAAWLGFWWASLIDYSLVRCNVQSQQLPSCTVCSQLFQSDGTLFILHYPLEITETYAAQLESMALMAF